MNDAEREQRLTLRNRRNAKKLAKDLSEAFVWENTPQGHDYWSEVRRNLMLIANGGNSNA